MTPKEKAKELIDMLNDKVKALSAVNEAIKDNQSTSMFYCSKVKRLPINYWQEVKQEIEKL